MIWVRAPGYARGVANRLLGILGTGGGGKGKLSDVEHKVTVRKLVSAFPFVQSEEIIREGLYFIRLIKVGQHI